VRRAEKKQLRASGDERLKGTKYQWLRHPARFSKAAWREFRRLREADLRTARAWALKETAMRLFEYRSAAAARRFFALWQGWASRSRLAPVLAVARMLKARLENVLTYLQYRVTNAVSEALKAKIQWVKATARGFRNQNNFITAIYFHCGGLDLAPAH
jgi:transposase